MFTKAMSTQWQRVISQSRRKFSNEIPDSITGPSPDFFPGQSRSSPIKRPSFGSHRREGSNFDNKRNNFNRDRSPQQNHGYTNRSNQDDQGYDPNSITTRRFNNNDNNNNNPSGRFQTPQNRDRKGSFSRAPLPRRPRRDNEPLNNHQNTPRQPRAPKVKNDPNGEQPATEQTTKPTQLAPKVKEIKPNEYHERGKRFVWLKPLKKLPKLAELDPDLLFHGHVVSWMRTFGYIRNLKYKETVYFHKDNVRVPGFKKFEDGDQVTFRLGKNPQGFCADQIRLFKPKKNPKKAVTVMEIPNDPKAKTVIPTVLTTTNFKEVLKRAPKAPKAASGQEPVGNIDAKLIVAKHTQAENPIAAV